MTKTYRLFTEADGTRELLTLTASNSWEMQDKLDAEMEKPGREDCWVENYYGKEEG